MSTHDATPQGPVLTVPRKWASMVVVWVAAAVGAVLTGLYSPPGQRLLWVGVTLGAAVIATMCIQLATRQRQGFVDRVTGSIVGALAVLTIASIVFTLI